MANKIKNYFKRVFAEMIDARQRQINKLIELNGYGRKWDL